MLPKIYHLRNNSDELFNFYLPILTAEPFNYIHVDFECTSSLFYRNLGDKTFLLDHPCQEV